MKQERIRLGDSSAFLDIYVHHKSRELRRNKYQWQPLYRPALLILPGGGYLYIADSENEPLVLSYLKAGYNVFVLNYSVGDNSEYPKPLIEVSLAIAHIRLHSEEYGISKDNIAICGLSAGGHLAGLIATQWFNELCWKKQGISYELNKPNALILAYPLFDLKLYNNGDKEKGKIFGKMLWSESENVNSLENINEKMPPTFIWHTRDDPIVPSNQSLKLAMKLSEYQIPYELHIYHIGDHGLSTCDALSLYGKHGLRDYPVNVKSWLDLSINWLNSLFEFDEFDPMKYK